LIVKLNGPVAVGVPLSVPPLERDSPVGNAPEETAYVYDEVPPLAVIVAEYEEPTVGSDNVVGFKVTVGQVAAIE